MKELIKEVVAGFTRMNPEQISETTLIDSKAVASSIQLHRMYAKLAEQGIVVENYREIRTFGDLIQRLGNGQSRVEEPASPIGNHTFLNSAKENSSLSVGIDIESIDSFPGVPDFREDIFYKQNFTATEIAYCILQKNPGASFAGLFAAKEAIVKANNQFIGKSFHSIGIDHQPGGKPVYPGFQLSITHSDTLAIAVAIENPTLDTSTALVSGGSLDQGASKGGTWLIFLAILLSLVAISLQLFR